LDSDVVFIDSGNLFDAHAVSRHCTILGLEPEKVQERIHLSRAFTHHQVHSLIIDKLPSAIERYNAKLVVISDLTALFSDPDVRDRREAREVFNNSVLFLGKIAEQRNVLVLATSLKTRDKTMDNILIRTAHVSARLTGRGAYMQLTVARHPFSPEREESVATPDDQTLEHYNPVKNSIS
jgi:predicted amidohydrolase